MPYVPYISDLKPFYIQCSGDAAAIDVTQAYGCVPKSQPYPDDYEVKDPYAIDWPDRHGGDEWTDEMYLKPFDHTVEFYIKAYPSGTRTATEVLASQRDALLGKIRQGSFAIFDSSVSRGYRNVRFVSSKVTTDRTKLFDDCAWMIFNVTFRINDPLTRLTMTGGAIIEEE